jgi:hypothetical protein
VRRRNKTCRAAFASCAFRHQPSDYFVHPATYDTSNAGAALSSSGIVVPRLADYAANLVAFARAHPEIGSAAMA